jgi:hypothetical protein
VAGNQAGDFRKLKTPVLLSSRESLTALLGGHIDLYIGSVGPLTKNLDSVHVELLDVCNELGLAKRLD